MNNRKGFTLMELLVAVFIASMVVIALMTVWKASSMQTSQGQRQSIIRNNLSIFMRALHRDITEADLILAPDKNTSGALIVAVRNAYLVKRGSNYYVEPNTISYTQDPGGPQIESEPVAFAYCLEGNTIRRSAEIPLKELSTDSLEKLTLISNAESACSSGRIYMDYIVSNGFDVSTDDNINYTVSLIVHKDFEGSENPPVHIEMSKTFIKAGGA